MWQAWVLLKLNHVNVTWSTGREFLRDTMNIVTSTTFSSFRVSSIVLPSNILILHKSLFFLFHFNKLIFILYPLFFKFLPMNLHVSLKYYFQNSFNVLKFKIKINEDWTKRIILSIENKIIFELFVCSKNIFVNFEITINLPFPKFPIWIRRKFATTLPQISL